MYYVRPRGLKKGHVFRIFIHFDVVEDLLFFHYPREELLAKGRMPWREFTWHYGHAGGEFEEDDLDINVRHYG